VSGGQYGTGIRKGSGHSLTPVFSPDPSVALLFHFRHFAAFGPLHHSSQLIHLLQVTQSLHLTRVSRQYPFRELLLQPGMLHLALRPIVTALG
jgi:hypothetical protein